MLRNFKNTLKSVAIRSRFHLLLKPFRGSLLYLAYLGNVVAWGLEAWKMQPEAVLRTRNELYEWINEKVGGAPIDYLEFGVWTGNSFRWWLNANTAAESRFVGFDTFTGLPKAWGYYDKNHFDTGGQLPDIVDSRATFQVGLFQNTLDNFLKAHQFAHRKVVNIDADLYSSTLFVLTSLAPQLQAGDIIIFDEFLAWRTPTDQYRAFTDFVSAFYVDYRFVGAARNFEKVAVEVVAVSSDGGHGRQVE